MTMELARNWRLRRTRLSLEGARCAACGKLVFPARPVCPDCRGRILEPHRFSGRGEVYSFSTVYEPPSGFTAFAPYTVAMIRLAEGPMVMAQLTDVNPDAVFIGMPVEMVTRKLSEDGDDGLIVYGYKFRPPLPEYKNGHASADALASTEPTIQAEAVRIAN